MGVELIVGVLYKGMLGFLGLFMYASFFEWTLHKYLMHSPLWDYPFQAHALVHHGIFRADHTYHLRSEKNKKKVTFAWWNAPGLLFLHMPLLCGLSYACGWPVFWGGVLALVLYYVLYESLHWCMHIPQNRWVERTRVFQWLNTRHYFHHRYAFKNLNVVFPLADVVFGSFVSVGTAHPIRKELNKRLAHHVPVLSASL